MKNHLLFSSELEQWLKSKQPKTIGNLSAVFGERSFAIIFLLLNFLPALPIPTGGITHLVLQPVTALLAIEMIFARRTVWVPTRLSQHSIGNLIEGRALPFIVRRVRWFERYSRRRLAGSFDHAAFRTITGLVILLFTLAAFIAPPFSGLDTLPSLGIVIMALAIILGDMALYAVGVVTGVAGVGLIVGAGKLVSVLFEKVF